MCYICHSFSGHASGCPFEERTVKEHKCIECGKETCQEDTYTIYRSGKCLCNKCACLVIYGEEGEDDE